MNKIQEKLALLKPILAAQFAVKRIGYFGSYATEMQTESSDLDVLVEFAKPIGWKFFALEKFLEDEIGLKIDLVTQNALKEQLKDDILKKVIYV